MWLSLTILCMSHHAQFNLTATAFVTSAHWLIRTDLHAIMKYPRETAATWRMLRQLFARATGGFNFAQGSSIFILWMWQKQTPFVATQYTKRGQHYMQVFSMFFVFWSVKLCFSYCQKLFSRRWRGGCKLGVFLRLSRTRTLKGTDACLEFFQWWSATESGLIVHLILHRRLFLRGVNKFSRYDGVLIPTNSLIKPRSRLF